MTKKNATVDRKFHGLGIHKAFLQKSNGVIPTISGYGVSSAKGKKSQKVLLIVPLSKHASSSHKYVGQKVLTLSQHASTACFRGPLRALIIALVRLGLDGVSKMTMTKTDERLHPERKYTKRKRQETTYQVLTVHSTLFKAIWKTNLAFCFQKYLVCFIDCRIPTNLFIRS